MISIQKEDISPEEIINALKVPEAGAVVSFLGVVRKDPNVTLGLEVEAYEGMVLRKLREVQNAAKERFQIQDIAIVHRIGRIAVGGNITFIASSAAHRSDAFAATKWALEEVKKTVPLWKKEI
ncbi:MAG: molybdenum cofactor biosynthesis protein MoaE [Thermoplasmata archaeon]|nr:molybdenum cofactor biosynthesis protein MoaE [Thermoplasmata archaeon]